PTTPDPDPTGTTPDGRCAVAITVVNEWPGGFQGEITVLNTGDNVITPWELTWAFGGDERIQNAWGAAVTQDGTAVVATAPSWSQALEPGGSVSIGFTATASSSPSAAGFSLNALPCTIR